MEEAELLVGLELRKSYKISEIVTIVSEALKKNNLNFLNFIQMDFCLYTLGYTEDVTIDTICYIERPQEVTDDDEEIFPDFVIENSLNFLYSSELLENVIFNALHQKSNPSMKEFIECLNHYDKKDNFLDLK